MIKEITQNPERYSKKVDKYQISASPDIKPLELPIGSLPEGLLPVLQVDGIIVNVGDYKLISQATLDLIKESNNPHYDVRKNGEVKTTSGKSGSIGQTIPSITLNIESLSVMGTKRDLLNRIGGVIDVNYVYEGPTIQDTYITQNLVDQINYTLNPNIDRPMDEYKLVSVQLSDEANYDLSTLVLATAQNEDKLFNNTKLQDFLTGIKERMKALTLDFHTIRDIHYNGDIPDTWPIYSVNKRASAEDEQEDGDFDIVTKTSDLISVEKTPAQQLEEKQQAAKKELQNNIDQATTTQQQALASVAAADSRSQAYIQQQLDSTRAQLVATNAELIKVQQSSQK
jgi:hypothetical protein